MKEDWRIIDRFDDFLFLKESWKQLEKKVGNRNISVSYDWCFLWWDVFKNKEDNTFGYDKQLKIVVKYSENSELEFVAPLILLKRIFFKIEIAFVEFLGQQWGATTFSFLMYPNDYIDFRKFEMFCSKNIKFDILYLRNIPISDNQFYDKRLNINAGCPQIDLTRYDSYEQLYSSYPKNLRQNIRTAHNRVKKQGYSLSVNIEQVEFVDWKDIIKVSESKKNSGKYSLYDDQDKRLFFIRVSTTLNSNFVLAKLDNNLISYRFNVIYNNIKFCIDASYDRNYPQYNLGALTVCANVEDSCHLNLDLHSMGPGCYDYKLKFTSDINYLGFFVSGILGSLRGFFLSKLFLFYLKHRKFQL